MEGVQVQAIAMAPYVVLHSFLKHGLHKHVLFQRLKLLVLPWQCSLLVFMDLVSNSFMI